MLQLVARECLVSDIGEGVNQLYRELALRDYIQEDLNIVK